jgi:Tol biopolymer transport system component
LVTVRYPGTVAAVLAAAIVVASGCGGEPPVDHGGSLVSEEGQIAFTRATKFTPPDFQSEVFTINVDGSGERKLTSSPGLDAFPAWSPDGEHIAFTSERDGNWELYLMNPDGTEQRRLTNTPEDESSPAWSPEGEKIVYVTDVIDGNETIHVMNADGSGQRILGASVLQRLLGIRGAEEPAWSPEGKKIAFASYAGRNNSEIYIMNSDGTGRTRLTDIPGHDHWPPTWSPDGGRIAFTSDGVEEVGEIYVMNSDGSGLTKLTDDPADDSFPAWRP